MKFPNWVTPLFYAAALYDGILGIAGISMPVRIYALFGAVLPNHMAYVHFPALLLISVSFACIPVSPD